MTAISADILQQAIELYLERAYPPGALPAATQSRIGPIRELAPAEAVPESLLEKDASASEAGFALRLGQPLYPHMKLIIEPAPPVPLASTTSPAAATILLRVDTHDRHLHATPGSPDAAWLASIRASNKQLTEQIEDRLVRRPPAHVQGFPPPATRREESEPRGNAPLRVHDLTSFEFRVSS